jgi:hypothetical protein
MYASDQFCGRNDDKRLPRVLLLLLLLLLQLLQLLQLLAANVG